VASVSVSLKSSTNNLPILEYSFADGVELGVSCHQ
jgi:hypothetical protein